jgi:hypothetical protein
VDLHVAALELAAAYFVTRPEMRRRDALVASLALTLAVGSKAMALVPVGLLAPYALVRVIAQNRKRPWLPTIGAILGGAGLLFTMLASIYVRNWIVFKNPFWPELKFDSDTLGIHWPGALEWGTGQEELGYTRIDMNLPWGQFFEDLFSVPYSWRRSHYTEMHDYGFLVQWIVFPLGCLVVVVLWFSAMRALLGWIVRRPWWGLASESWSLVYLSFVAWAMLYSTPALWASRYNIAAVGILAAAIAWAGGREGWHRVGEGFAGVAALGSLVGFCWTTPRWWYTPSELVALSDVPYPKREFTLAQTISPNLPTTSGSPVMTETGLLREKTLGSGAVLVFDESDGFFPGLFWNNDYTSRTVFVPAGPDYPGRAMAAGALWIHCARSDAMCRQLKSPDWTDIGALSIERWGDVYRRNAW